MLQRPARMDGARQAAGINLVDLLWREPWGKACAEMAAGFDDDRPRRTDIEAEHMEKHRVGCLRASNRDSRKG